MNVGRVLYILSILLGHTHTHTHTSVHNSFLSLGFLILASRTEWKMVEIVFACARPPALKVHSTLIIICRRNVHCCTVSMNMIQTERPENKSLNEKEPSGLEKSHCLQFVMEDL